MEDDLQDILKDGADTPKPEKKLTPLEFVLRAVELSREDGWAGCHVVYSGFNEAFKKYFGADPAKVLEKLEAQGKIRVRPVKGGDMIFPVDDFIPQGKVSDLLERITKA